MNAKDIKRKLEKAGFVLRRTHGSHMIFTKKGFKQIIVQNHGGRDIPTGTVHQILKDAGLK